MPAAAPPLIGTFDTVVGCLTPVTAGQWRHFLGLPPTRSAHAEAHAAVSAFGQVEIGGSSVTAPGAGPLRVAAWNLERCLYPHVAAHMLRRHGVRLALLTEMDRGMLRTGQAHTIAAVAAALGHRYAYGLEFLELLSMPPPTGFARRGDDNDQGFHGNGIVSALPLAHPVVIRLDEVADWYVAPKGGQRRIGNRMAVAGIVTVGESRFVACSVHLESATDGPGRATQMRGLLDALDRYAEGLPVLIGGDLNTHVPPGGHDDPREPLFSLTKRRGYNFDACNLAGPTTRASVWSESEATRQLDWFCTRGLTTEAPEIIPALAPDGTVLTDHELILVTIR
ncbi:MAG TPA: endonuclease/exonuclease/phosphatase [Acetobacteraceae bacterium]|nr:endonuclease/exonuclease/phosphatase [Acetobacteraceae bacterium]